MNFNKSYTNNLNNLNFKLFKNFFIITIYNMRKTNNGNIYNLIESDLLNMPKNVNSSKINYPTNIDNNLLANVYSKTNKTNKKRIIENFAVAESESNNLFVTQPAIKNIVIPEEASKQVVVQATATATAQEAKLLTGVQEVSNSQAVSQAVSQSVPSAVTKIISESLVRSEIPFSEYIIRKESQQEALVRSAVQQK